MATSAVLGLLSAPPVAAAEPCVGVIVDARLLGGRVDTACADGDPDSGLDALTMAGFRYAFVPRQPGLVCQIDGQPECSRTSTTTYWSYWYRAKGSSRWVYANEGAGTHDPEPGSTEAWVWQDGGRREPPDVALRRICPQVANRTGTSASPSPERTRETTRSAEPRPSTAAAASGSSGRTDERSSPDATRTTEPPPSASPATDTSADRETATPAQSGVASEGQLANRDSGGVPWAGVVLGGGLIAALGGAAFARARAGSSGS
ncbi:MAG TPA: hypothetical protein VF423_14260 [Actinomycetes bacterium]